MRINIVRIACAAVLMVLGAMPTAYADNLASDANGEQISSEEDAPLTFDEARDAVLDEDATATPPLHACAQFDGQPVRCENNGCFFNWRNNRCTRGGGGGPDRRYWTCQAQDRGFEEHWRAHAGTGWTRAQAANEALRQCQNFHGRCYITSCYVR